MNKISFFRKFSIPLMELKYITKLFLLLPLIFILHLNTPAEIRYVSKTGLSIPPYNSWEIAADSIQKCINICQFGDTIYVANGEYRERVIMIQGLSLFGAGMDSCIINSTGITSPSGNYAIKMTDICRLEGFQLIPLNSQGIGIYIYDTSIQFLNVTVKSNKIIYAGTGIRVSSSSLGVDNDYKRSPKI